LKNLGRPRDNFGGLFFCEFRNLLYVGLDFLGLGFRRLRFVQTFAGVHDLTLRYNVGAGQHDSRKLRDESDGNGAVASGASPHIAAMGVDCRNRQRSKKKRVKDDGPEEGLLQALSAWIWRGVS